VWYLSPRSQVVLHGPSRRRDVGADAAPLRRCGAGHRSRPQPPRPGRRQGPGTAGKGPARPPLRWPKPLSRIAEGRCYIAGTLLRGVSMRTRWSGIRRRVSAHPRASLLIAIVALLALSGAGAYLATRPA